MVEYEQQICLFGYKKQYPDKKMNQIISSLNSYIWKNSNFCLYNSWKQQEWVVRVGAGKMRPLSDGYIVEASC